MKRNQEPAFSIGDLVTDGRFRLRVVMPIQERNGSWTYECEAVDFKAPFNREIPQDRLERLFDPATMTEI